jgi:hypothetical protein
LYAFPGCRSVAWIADNIIDQTVDRTKAAGDLESVHEILLAGDRDTNAVGPKLWRTGIEREPRHSMASEIDEARPELTAKNEGHGWHNWPDRTQWTSRK